MQFISHSIPLAHWFSVCALASFVVGCSTTDLSKQDEGQLCTAFVLQDDRTGKLLDAMAWGVKTASGQLIEGITGEDGKINIPCSYGEVSLEYTQQTRMGIRHIRHKSFKTIPVTLQLFYTMKVQTFESVWDAIDNSPEEAAEMKRRSGLMIDLQQHIKTCGVGHAVIADLLELSPQRMDALMRGRISQFSSVELEDMARTVGLSLPARR